MQYGDYVRMLILDNEEREKIKQNKILEAEKAQYSVYKYFSIFLVGPFIFILVIIESNIK
jgi:hypothetical protein